MDPVVKIRRDIQTRVNRLGAEIIRSAEEKKEIFGSADLSEADKIERVDAARDLLRQNMEIVFGEGDGSISFDIQRVLEASKEQTTEMERAQKAADIWRQELSGLQQFLEYCAGIIEAHPGEMSPELHESQKCLTEASVVLDKISTRVARVLKET